MKNNKHTPGQFGTDYKIRNDDNYMVAEIGPNAQDANAALIAAAPEMLEALEALHYRLTVGLGADEYSVDAIEHELKACFAALAKAKGE